MRLNALYSKPLSQPVTQAGLDCGTWDPNSPITEGINFGESSKILLPGVTETERLLSTPVEREIFYDTTLKTLYYGDGTTIGGIPVGSNSISYIVAAAVG